MTRILQPVDVDGIEFYSPESAEEYADYPESGFETTTRDVAESFWVSSRRRLFLALVRKLLPANQSAARLLEVGCGTGDFLSFLKQRLPQLQITGSEIYGAGLRQAVRTHPDIRFIQYDATKGRLPGEFDLITAFDVIEHIPDDVAALQNLASMIAPGGKLLVSVPQYMFLWSQLDTLVHHKRRYSKGELIKKARMAGLVPERTTSFVFLLFPLMLVSRLLDKGSAPADQQDAAAALDQRTGFPGPVNWLFDQLMRVDEFLIRMGVSLPFGGTLVMVARKSADGSGH